jgi:ribulose 1,5-bisphosphate carboxylase large subunit-like protein
MLDKLKRAMGMKEKPVEKTKAKPKQKKTDKEIATAAGEPYVSILSMDVDPENINNGAFELDWNEKFIANLVRAGYQLKPNEEEHVIVDRWFQNVCRNVAMETYEQSQADPEIRYTQSRDLGDGYTEVK